MVGLQRHLQRHRAGYCRERRRTTVSEIRTKQTVTLGDTSYTRSFPQILNTKAAKGPGAYSARYACTGAAFKSLPRAATTPKPVAYTLTHNRLLTIDV
jgi:hypothetical protein